MFTNASYSTLKTVAIWFKPTTSVRKLYYKIITDKIHFLFLLIDVNLLFILVKVPWRDRIPHSKHWLKETQILCLLNISRLVSSGKFWRDLLEIGSANLFGRSPDLGNPWSTQILNLPIFSTTFEIRERLTWESCHDPGKLMQANIILPVGAKQKRCRSWCHYNW